MLSISFCEGSGWDQLRALDSAICECLRCLWVVMLIRFPKCVMKDPLGTFVLVNTPICFFLLPVGRASMCL
jgi:hypothetical protein